MCARSERALETTKLTKQTTLNNVLSAALLRVNEGVDRTAVYGHYWTVRDLLSAHNLKK